MAESINGLYETEVIHRQSWKNRQEVELATLSWVDWYNNRRLLERLGHIPPSEAEKEYYASIGNRNLAAEFPDLTFSPQNRYGSINTNGRGRAAFRLTNVLNTAKSSSSGSPDIQPLILLK